MQWKSIVRQLEKDLKDRDLQLAKLETHIQVIEARRVESDVAPALSFPVAEGLVWWRRIRIVHECQLTATRSAELEITVSSLRQQVEMLQSEKRASERQLQADVDAARDAQRAIAIELAAAKGQADILQQKLDWATRQAERSADEASRLRLVQLSFQGLFQY